MPYISSFTSATSPYHPNPVVQTEPSQRYILFMKIAKFIVVVILIWIGYLVYVWIASVKEIQQVCSQIKAGQSKQEVIDVIQASEYLRYFESGDNQKAEQGLMIYSPKSHARYTCWIELDGSVVVKSNYRAD
ncbi:MAG: hypothetical protein PVG96_03230 [Desulfobacterales bacterium]